MMNLIQAMEILNERRPNKPRSLDNRKLQQAIDVVNEYVDEMPDKFKHRCIECKNCCTYYKNKLMCSTFVKDVNGNSTSCGLWFVKREDNNEKTD